MIVDALGGEPHLLSETQFEDPGRFSPDGNSVLTSADGEIMLVGLDGTVVETIAEPGAYLFGPVWSPDGEWIAFSRGMGGPVADVFTSKVDGSGRAQVTDTAANEIRVEWGAQSP